MPEETFSVDYDEAVRVGKEFFKVISVIGSGGGNEEMYKKSHKLGRDYVDFVARAFRRDVIITTADMIGPPGSDIVRELGFKHDA